MQGISQGLFTQAQSTASAQAIRFGAKATLDQFKQSLGEAMAWGKLKASKANMKDSLRTQALQPPAQGPFADFGNQAKLESGFQRINHHRKAQLKSMGINPAPVNQLTSGKLMVFFPSMTLSDGAAEAESKGFIDPDNVPAWDTWVKVGQVKSPPGWTAQTMPYIVAWVPHSFLPEVDRAIQVNPEECIQWLDNPTLPSELRQLQGAVQ